MKRGVSMLYRNVDEVTVDLFALPESEVLKLSGGDQWQVWEDYAIPGGEAQRIWRRTYDTSGSPNVSIRQIITVTDELGELLPPGAYFLTVAAPELNVQDENRLTDQAALILSDANLVVKKSQYGSSLAWLTDLKTGDPLPGIPIRFTMDGNQVGSQITDEEGVAQLYLDMPPDRQWTPVVAISGEEGDPAYAVTSTDWNDGIAPWDFNLIAGYGGEPVKAYFYTERPIYRPGDTVYWKGILRVLLDDAYTLPPSELPDLYHDT